MTDTLEELTVETLDRDHIERRVDDWAVRIKNLYDQIVSWLPSGWSVAPEQRVRRMFEPPMREVGIPPRDLPVLDLLKNGQRAAFIDPRSLWIIGGDNGRLERYHFKLERSRN